MISHIARKWSVIFVPLAVTAFIGVAEMAAPVDLVHETMANKARLHDASGQVVVVGIEDASTPVLGEWPWSGDQTAAVTHALFEQGARNVYFSESMGALDAVEDAAFLQAVSQYAGRVSVALDTQDGRSLNHTSSAEADPLLDGKAETLSAMQYAGFWHGVDEYAYSYTINGQPIRSVAAAIAGVDRPAGDTFPVDYALDVSSIPYISAHKLIEPGMDASPRLDGKDVLIGFSSHSSADTLPTLGQGHVADVFVMALGAETLLQGQPSVWGWIPLWLVAAAAMLFVLTTKMGRLSLWIGAAALATCLVAPGILVSFNIHVLGGPGLILSIVTQLIVARRTFGRRERASGSVNPVSGLQTLNAIRNDDRLEARALIAARVRRYTEIVSTLPPKHERLLVSAILARLRLGAGDAEILHGDDGNLYWLSEIEDPAVLVQQLDSLRAIFREPILVDGRGFSIDVAYGIDQQHDVAVSHRLNSALAAALSAEADFTNFKLHDPLAQGETAWSLSMLAELDAALDAGQFWVAYQPQLDLKQNKLTGAEALARWSHDTRGPISPNEFVAVAEQHGRIDRLTAYVIEDALSVAMRVQEQDPDFKVSVNLSPSLLQSTDILETVKTLLLQYPVDPDCLILEVTETLEFGESGTPIAVMNALREMGVGLSIDDYGTGHSTLDYVRKIPATEVKIDRSFVEHVCENHNDRTVIASSIELTHAMGMKVVAEGVESEAALQLLNGLGCDFAQGYHVARPMREARLLELIVGDAVSPEAGTSG